MTKPVEARDLSGLWDPSAAAVPVQPDFERLRRLARLQPDEPGYNPMALTLAEIDQQELAWQQQQQQQQQ